MSISGLKINETDDEFFGTLESRSNLANLFGVNQQAADVNQSLKYKPPKQAQGPPDSGGNDATSAAWNVQVAKVVTAFKLINQENVSQGRVGLALLKNSHNNFKVIVYRTKTNVLATITLQSSTKLILKSSYLQFHDDSQEFWSIFLETSDEKAFIEHLPAEFLSKIEEPKEEPQTIPIEPQPNLTTDDSDTANKAKLLSRMARMGQPLPKLATPTTATDMSDSSDTEVINIPPKPSIVPRKVTKQLVPMGNALQSTSIIAYSPQLQENQYMNMLLTENRTQNTELRMNLSKLETKIERVLDKIDTIGSQSQSNSRDKDDEIVGLEEKVLELRKENRTLRQTVREFEAKKAPPVRNEPKLRVEVFSGFSDVIEDLGVHLEDCTDLEDVTVELLEKSRTRLAELRNEGKRKDRELADSRTEIERLKTENVDLTKAVKDCGDVETKAESLSKENNDLKRQLDSVKPINSSDNLQVVVKQIMNNLYGSITTSLDTTTDPLTKETFLRICGSAIRKETINIIQGNIN